MQHHMRAKSRDKNSTSYAWIFGTVFGTNSGQKVHIWCLDVCTMLGTSWAQDIHVLCLDFCTVAATHQDIRTNPLFCPTFNFFTRFLCLENDVHCITQLFFQNFSCAQLWWFLWNICLHFGTVSGTGLGQWAYQTYMIVVRVWRVHGAVFKTCWQLAWRAKRKHPETSLKPSSDCMWCKMRRVINCTKDCQGN